MLIEDNAPKSFFFFFNQTPSTKSVYFWASAFVFKLHDYFGRIGWKKLFLSGHAVIFTIKPTLYLYQCCDITFPKVDLYCLNSLAAESSLLLYYVKVVQASQPQIKTCSPSMSALVWLIYNLRLRGALWFFQVSLDFDSEMAPSCPYLSWDCKGWMTNSTVYLQLTFW